jgi:phosphoribosylanthranilate isomerase
VTRVKFCGITSVDDAELCAGHGAWALGMIFVAHSPRRCKQSEAARIAGALRRRVELVGVFQNPTLDHVTRTADSLGLSMIQLHGEEGPSFCSEVARRTGAKIIKAARIRTRADVVALQPHATDFHLLDGPGGGVPFDWRLARAHRSKVPLIVAGGLTAENVAEAIEATDPFAVDVAGGVEAEGRPGTKDPGKVAAFADAVHGVHV